MPTATADIKSVRYEHLQEIGRRLTLEIAKAVLDEKWDLVDELLLRKNEINRQLREARDGQTG